MAGSSGDGPAVLSDGAFDPGTLVDFFFLQAAQDEGFVHQLEVSDLLVGEPGGDGLELELEDVVAEKEAAEEIRLGFCGMAHEELEQRAGDRCFRIFDELRR